MSGVNNGFAKVYFNYILYMMIKLENGRETESIHVCLERAEILSKKLGKHVCSLIN